jgi:hypothetical protein
MARFIASTMHQVPSRRSCSTENIGPRRTCSTFLVHIDREHASCLQQVFDPPLSRRTVAPHTAQASAAGEKSSAARSTRSWFRLTGGFRHPSLFSLRRLTSPSVEAANLIAPLRPAGSPFRLGIPAVAALSAPLQDGLRFFQHPLPPPLWPFLGFRPGAGRMGLTLLPDGELRPGRLRPFVRRGLMSPSPVALSGDPTRLPFGPGHQPLGPVLCHGL